MKYMSVNVMGIYRKIIVAEKGNKISYLGVGEGEGQTHNIFQSLSFALLIDVCFSEND